jgi:pyrimidine-nucleoside phosphorylase
MTNLEDARKLAELMVEIGKLVDRKTVAILSDMNQPLGKAVGNSLELQEALETLKGSGPDDFCGHCMEASGYMLALGGLAKDEVHGRQMAESALVSGAAYRRFRDLVQAQGGDTRYVDNPGLLKKARLVLAIKAPQSGYLAEINAREAGETAVLLGGGRERKGDTIDYTVGIIVHHKVGDKVTKGDDLFTIHANNKEKLKLAKEKMLAAHVWSDQPVVPLPLYYGVVI